MTRTNNVLAHDLRILFILAAASVLTSLQGHVLEFTIEPSDTVVEAGRSAVLDCVVKAADYPSNILIQWLDQDRQILTFIGDSYRSQLTNGSLYISSVVEEQGLTGTYQCMASLPNVGSVVSRSAKLSLASLSGFQQEPRDITVYPGQKAYFACRVQASPPPRIKWLKDERPLQIDEIRMTVLPSGALEIDEVRESDQGSYRCNASGLNSYRLSNKASLIINGDLEQAQSLSPPSFIASPRSEIVIEGQTVTLDCTANGNPTPLIRWLKDGYEIDMADLDSRFSMVGSTSSLRITNIQEMDNGIYQCRAENREDSVDAPATIQVQVPPKFLKKPEDKVDVINKDVELECSVYGVPEPKVQWLKNGEIINPNDYYQLINGYNLKIMGLMTTDSGIFQCVASNPAGNIQASASLKVVTSDEKPKNRNSHKTNRRKKNPGLRKNDEIKPIDKTQSLSLFSSLKSEKSAKLGEVNFGHLAPTKPNNHNLDASKHSGLDPHSIFTSLRSSETNDNNLGDVLSAYSFASSKPFIAEDYSESTRSSEGLPGPPKDLKAPIIKARFVVLSWKPPSVNNESIVTYSVYYRQEGSERERVQNTSRSRLEDISIGNLQPGRVYHFRVVAYNSYGAGPSSESLSITTLSEEHVPSAPQQFVAYATSPRSIHVSWSKPEIPNGEILRYTVYYMETSSSVEHNIDSNNLECDLIGLSVYTEYSVWVVAVNHNGAGAATEEKLVRTYGAPPSEPPYNVTLEPASSTSIIIRWEPPPVEGQNGVITGYKLKYRQQGKKAETATTAANQRIYVLSDLERGSLYQVKLWAINLNGTGPPTEWIDVKTYENDLDETRVPDAPSPMKVQPASDKIYVMWGPPANQNIKVRSYILGWGKGIPDMYSQELDEKQRNYVIEHLESNSEYVLSLRASNIMGPGPSVYAKVWTQDEIPQEPQKPLIPPVGLKAQVLSTTSVVLYWTDTTLSKSQYVRDNRYYVVQYTDTKSSRTRYINVTTLNVMIDDLKPNTMYEFCVKLVKGRKESPWSMVVTNSTWELAPNAAPRDLRVHFKEDSPQTVEVTWQPPKVSSSRITGYVIMYTDDNSKNDREWFVEAIKGDKHSSTLTDLRPSTVYYFKVQARNSRGYGPFSNIVSFRTSQNVGVVASDKSHQIGGKGLFSGTTLLYLIIGGCLLAVVTIAVVIVVLCCRRRDTTTSPDRSKKGYQKSIQNVKPPDLWIHHDQMELKALEKNHSNNDGASSSGAVTLPRSVGTNDYDAHENQHSSSLDKRTYVPSYMGVSSDDKCKRPVKSKPITFPVDAKPPREPIATATPINTASLSQTSSDSTPSSRPSYPRTQYTISRAHVTIDQNALAANQPVESPYASHTTHSGYETTPVGYTSQPPPVAHIPHSSGYAPGMSVLAESQGGKRLQAQGHPLKSFTVPAPPPTSAPGTPQPKHIGNIVVRPNSSPYKKAPTSSSSTLTSTPPSRISASNPPPHTAEEVQRLQPSHSTEELNQEMANLEGLMLTLNAITANEFEC